MPLKQVIVPKIGPDPDEVAWLPIVIDVPRKLGRRSDPPTSA
jgi:hypothetical protein